MDYTVYFSILKITMQHAKTRKYISCVTVQSMVCTPVKDLVPVLGQRMHAVFDSVGACTWAMCKHSVNCALHYKPLSSSVCLARFLFPVVPTCILNPHSGHGSELLLLLDVPWPRAVRAALQRPHLLCSVLSACIVSEQRSRAYFHCSVFCGSRNVSGPPFSVLYCLVVYITL